MFGKACQTFLLVVALVLVLDFSGFLDYDYEDDDEDDRRPTIRTENASPNKASENLTGTV